MNASVFDIIGTFATRLPQGAYQRHQKEALVAPKYDEQSRAQQQLDAIEIAETQQDTRQWDLQQEKIRASKIKEQRNQLKQQKKEIKLDTAQLFGSAVVDAVKLKGLEFLDTILSGEDEIDPNRNIETLWNTFKYGKQQNDNVIQNINNDLDSNRQSLQQQKAWIQSRRDAVIAAHDNLNTAQKVYNQGKRAYVKSRVPGSVLSDTIMQVAFEGDANNRPPQFTPR